MSAGYARELCGRGVSCALGVLGTLYLVPAELALFYGSRTPVGVAIYLRLQPVGAREGGMKMEGMPGMHGGSHD